jgi:protease IV
VLGLFVRLVWLLAWVIALPWRLLRRLRARTRPGTYLLVEVDGPVTEIPPGRRSWLVRAKPPLSLHTLRLLLDTAAKDPRITGLVLVIRGLRAGPATAASIRSLLTRWRGAKKTAVVHLPLGGGTREVYVAAAADRVLLGPQSGLAAVGFLSATRYLRGALDKAGIVPEVTARGRYKTAAERVERASMSEPQREQVEAMLDGVYGEVTAALATGRRVEPDAARAMIDGGPYSGDEAVAAGLVDGVAYEDELALRLAEGTGDGSAPAKKARIVPADSWWRPRLAMRPAALRSAGVIGVVKVHGAIAGDAGLPFRSMALDERVIAAVRLARLNPFVRGVVLHVDSPGGSALASDRMHHELVALAAEKPLVASMGDVAASGGYYVAVAAHAIVAQPTTLTGSIGVIGARLTLEPLLARLGVATEVLARGAHARLLDPMLPVSDDDRAAVEREIERIYQAFLRVVAEGRRRSVDEIHALAQGRVWTGADAHARGLVDHLGGFEDALDVVRQRIGRGAGRLRVVTLRPPGRGIPALDPPERKAARTIARTLEALAPTLGIDPSWLALRGERVLALDPFAATIRW